MLAGVTAAVSVVAFLSPTIQANAQPEPTPPDDRVELIIFHGDGCPHCAKALDFLDGLQDRCLLYTSDAADARSSVDLGGRRIIKKKTN